MRGKTWRRTWRRRGRKCTIRQCMNKYGACIPMQRTPQTLISWSGKQKIAFERRRQRVLALGRPGFGPSTCRVRVGEVHRGSATRYISILEQRRRLHPRRIEYYRLSLLTKRRPAFDFLCRSIPREATEGITHSAQEYDHACFRCLGRSTRQCFLTSKKSRS